MHLQPSAGCGPLGKCKQRVKGDTSTVAQSESLPLLSTYDALMIVPFHSEWGICESYFVRMIREVWLETGVLDDSY